MRSRTVFRIFAIVALLGLIGIKGRMLSSMRCLGQQVIRTRSGFCIILLLLWNLNMTGCVDSVTVVDQTFAAQLFFANGEPAENKLVLFRHSNEKQNFSLITMDEFGKTVSTTCGFVAFQISTTRMDATRSSTPGVDRDISEKSMIFLVQNDDGEFERFDGVVAVDQKIVGKNFGLKVLYIGKPNFTICR